MRYMSNPYSHLNWRHVTFSKEELDMIRKAHLLDKRQSKITLANRSAFGPHILEVKKHG